MRFVNVKTFRCLTEVQLTRNSEKVFELSEWGNTSHKFTTKMKWFVPNRRIDIPALTKGILKRPLLRQTPPCS
jgi:hypothetical protein